jgi:glycogen debranching enzyme
MQKKIVETNEAKRLEESRKNKNIWHRWGPYLSDRQWGTVREDYSADGSAWEYFPHDHARSRAYRWGEDGIAGISDIKQNLCFALALWNEKDPIIKERFFGLTGNEGNHGEDVKEYYFYLANTPSHSYMKFLYKYPHNSYPYDLLVQENKKRKNQESRGGREYELLDTSIFDQNRYFDVFVEYAKNSPEDILIKIEIINRGLETKSICVLPTLWFRNTWSWGYGIESKPSIKYAPTGKDFDVFEANSEKLGLRWLYFEKAKEVLFTDNETNMQIFSQQNTNPYVKDGIDRYIVEGVKEAVNPDKTGTKATACYRFDIGSGESKIIRLRLCNTKDLASPFDSEFEAVFNIREHEMNEFYECLHPLNIDEDLKNIQKQAFAGLLWTKQFYYYSVKQWLNGDPSNPPPPEERKKSRNSEWLHIYCKDIISMPDKWEYPWFAAWDLAFHTIPLCLIDPDFAKQQLHLFTKEWYMHPNGQIPAYEWSFSDVNPPVMAWAVWEVYEIEGKYYGRRDTDFLKRMFNKLLLYFTWWVNRKDVYGNNVFEGGFLGLDNISIFDRSQPGIPDIVIEQSDGTAWMGMYCLNMLKISAELAKIDSAYEEWGGKFLQHFFYIADAMNHIGSDSINLWDEEDKFYYDLMRIPGRIERIKVRSMVGLIPLLAVETFKYEELFMHWPTGFTSLEDNQDLKTQLRWYMKHRPDLTKHKNVFIKGLEDDYNFSEKGLLLSFVEKERLEQILSRMLDENEFLSPYGIRSLSKYHEDNPVSINVYGKDYGIKYEPAESTTGMFGGNSNWRGPIWFPLNYMIIEALQEFYRYYGDDLKVECPKGSGKQMNLMEVSEELSRRLIAIFAVDASKNERRPVYGDLDEFQKDPLWKDGILFYEYFHGDNGAGLGASHQTGWTALIAKLITQI